jgi:hypothetical protein
MTGWSDGGRRRRGGHGNRRWCRELAAVDETRRGARDEIHKAKGDPDTWTSQPGRRRSIAGVIDLREEDNRDGENFKMHGKIARNSSCSQWKGEGVEAHQFRCSYEVRGRQFPLTPGARTGRQWRIEKWFSGALDEEKKGGKKTRGWETRFEDAEAWGAREQAATALCRGGRRDAGGCGPARFKI